MNPPLVIAIGIVLIAVQSTLISIVEILCGVKCVRDRLRYGAWPPELYFVWLKSIDWSAYADSKDFPLRVCLNSVGGTCGMTNRGEIGDHDAHMRVHLSWVEAS